MAGPVSWNFTIDDASPILSYSPYADGHGLTKGWQTWYTGSGYNTQTGEATSGESFHLTSLDGAQVSLTFYGVGIALYGTTNSSYEVVLDNSKIARLTTDQGVFFSQSDLDAGFHNVTLVAKPTSDQQVLSFRQAIVTSIAISNSSSPSTLTYDNQNTSAITYTGDWTPDKVVSGVPSSSSSVPFHTTSDFGASAILNFTGRAVAVYGSTTFGHGQYAVTLDGKERVLNGSSNWLIGDLLLFYEDGLNETVPHVLNITNLGDNEAFSLNRVDVTQFASASSVSAPSLRHPSVGAIVGPIVAAITILSVLSLYFCSRYRNRHRPKESGHSMFSSSILLPRWLRRGDGRLTPFVVILDRPQTAQSFTSSDANAYFSGYGYADRAKSPRQSRTPSSNLDVPYETDRPDSIFAPPTHVPTIYPSDSASHHQGDEITYPPRALPKPRATGNETPTRDQSALVDRILELVVQRIDGPQPGHAQNNVRSMTNDSLSRLPPYPEDYVMTSVKRGKGLVTLCHIPRCGPPMASPTEIFFPDTLPFPIKVHSLPVRAGASVKPGHRLLTYSFLHIPPGNVKESETRYGSWEATFDGEIKSWNVKIGDMITRQRARDKAVLNITEPCKHGIQFNGLCALCGMDMDNFDYTGRPESSRATIQMTHSASGPTVSLEEAQKLERDTAEHLLASRKLSLIVDLDQTIVHATVDPTVGEWISEGEAWEERQARREARKKKAKDAVNEEGSDDSSDSDDDEEEEDEVNPNWEALKDVKKFRLAPETFNAPRPRWQDKGKQKGLQNEGRLYYVKPRPGWQEFLPSIAKKYEMHVYTMGTRDYAEEVCAAIDPDGQFFGGRILSRDESGSLTQKSLRRLFPCDTSMVVIIDDRADVWEWSPNLLKVIPYDFFVGIGDINSTFLPKQVDLLKDVPTEQNVSVVDASPSLSPPPIPVPSSPELLSSLSDTSETTAVEDSDENRSVVKTEMITQNTLALEAQLEERPLAKKQELLEEDEEEEETPSDPPVESTANGVSSDASDQGKIKHHRKALLKNDDTELTRIGQLLDEVHRKFFEAYDNRLPENKLSKRRQSVVHREVPYDVKLIIPRLRMETFKDCHILFSGVIPTNTPIVHETTEIWRMARAFGATCHIDMVDVVTHVVTSKRGTQKVERARSRGGIFVVWIQWFQDSVARWKRQDERMYLVDDEAHSTTPQPESTSSPPSDPNAISTDTEPEELVGEIEGDGEAEAGEINEDELSKELLAAVGATEETSKSQGDTSGAPSEVTDLTPEDLDLGDVDWQNVNDEVDAAMMESDSEDDDRGSVASASGRSSNADEEESDLAMEDAENLPSLPSTPRGKRKRLRSLTPSEFNNRRDALRSPLAKRKKLAADRSGLSPLKETVLANDIRPNSVNDENEDMGDSRPATPTLAQDSAVNEDGEDEEVSDSSEGEEIDDDFLARELAEELG